jgi:histone-binding protein RBBP4
LSGCQPAICKPLFRANSRIFRPYSSDFSHQRLLIGTHTSNDEQNYVQIIKVKIPLESSKDTREFNPGLDDAPPQSGAT